jgi:signal transduction histidine kinase
LLREHVALKTAVQSACARCAPRLAAEKVHIDMDIPDNLWVHLDRALIEEAVVHLLQNALDAMWAGGEITITGLAARGELILEVADSGPGITPEMRARIFEPFFSTKRGAAGLGLTTVLRIAVAHGGRVVVRDCPEGGAAFTIFIPQSAQKAAA